MVVFSWNPKHALLWLSLAVSVHVAAGSSRSIFLARKVSSASDNDTSVLDGAISAILDGRSVEDEYKKLSVEDQTAAASRGTAAAAENLGVMVPSASPDAVDLAAVWVRQLGHENSAASVDDASIRKAIAALNKILARTWHQLGDRIVSCKVMKEKDQKWRAQLELDLVGASEELARITGTRTQAVNGIHGATTALNHMNYVWEEELKIFNKTMTRIDRAEALQKEDVEHLRKTVKLAKCPASASASFLAVSDRSIRKPQGLWLCKSNSTGKTSVYSSDAKEVTGALSQQILSRNYDIRDQSLLQDSYLNESVPNELQHLKCAIGRLGCAPVQLAAMRLLAASTDAIEDLHAQAREAEDKLRTVRKRVVKQQRKLRAHKMELEEQLAEAVSKMNSANALRRSLAEQAHAHIDESRSNYANCKTKVRVKFDTMCSLRKVRSSIASKSAQIGLDDIVDCDVTDWQPGECSVRCDDTCPQEGCGGVSTLTREVIQKPADLGMECPILSKTIACNQVKCPVPCKTSEWTPWDECTRPCGGGVSTRTRKVVQLAKHGGDVCGAPTDTKPCNTEACSSCNLKSWSNWTQCSSVCDAGYQVRTRDPVDSEENDEDTEDAFGPDMANCTTCYLGPPASFVEVKAAKCPASSSPDRFEQQSCMTKACKGDEVCIGNQDIIFAIDSSASLSPKAFESLRTFVVSLVSKFKAPVRIGILQFGGGALLDDGSISNGLTMMPITDDLNKAVSTIAGIQLLNGFPYMPPLFDNAEVMFKKARSGSDKMLLLITNSKPLFKEHTFERAAKLRKKDIRIFVVAASDFLQSGPLWETVNGDELSKIASAPMNQNFFQLPSLLGSKSGPGSFVSTVMGRTCGKLKSA